MTIWEEKSVRVGNGKQLIVGFKEKTKGQFYGGLALSVRGHACTVKPWLIVSCPYLFIPNCWCKCTHNFDDENCSNGINTSTEWRKITD